MTILKSAKWLAPQDGKIEIESFQAWNREHPEAQMSIAFRQSEWKQIDGWGTPTFYFFKQGVLVRKVVGWPPEGNKQALIAAAKILQKGDKEDGGN